jgi:transposase
MMTPNAVPMANKRPRPEHQPPPLVQVVPGLAHVVGSLALLRPLLSAMGIRALVDRLVPMQRERDDGISHGQVVETLIANRLISPRPLSRIDEWAKAQGVGISFGIAPDRLNDSRLGRTLDALTDDWDPASGTAPPLLEDLQTRVTLQFMRRFGVNAEDLGYDTTSLYFEGDYDQSELIRLGYSRDHRPDLKQVVMGVSATLEEGVVVHGRLYPGNRADSATTLETLARLKTLVPSARRVLITTDRGMMTPPVVHALFAQGESFIATLDATRAQLEVLRAIPDDAYRPSANREGYRVAESSVEVVDQTDKKAPLGITVRAVAVYAPGKAERDRKARTRALARIDRRLTAIGAKLGQRRYKNLGYAQSRVQAIFQDDLRQYRSLYTIDLLAGEDEGSVAGMAVSQDRGGYERLRALDGRYFIITSMPETYDADRVLEAYKRRDVCEQAMRIMKTDLKVRPIFLHNDSRVAALAYITVFALMVFTLLGALAKRLDLGTTARHIFDRFWTVTFVKIRQLDGQWLETYLNVDSAQLRVLEALGLPAGASP